MVVVLYAYIVSLGAIVPFDVTFVCTGKAQQHHHWPSHNKLTSHQAHTQHNICLSLTYSSQQLNFVQPSVFILISRSWRICKVLLSTCMCDIPNSCTTAFSALWMLTYTLALLNVERVYKYYFSVGRRGEFWFRNLLYYDAHPYTPHNYSRNAVAFVFGYVMSLQRYRIKFAWFSQGKSIFVDGCPRTHHLIIAFSGGSFQSV